MSNQDKLRHNRSWPLGATRGAPREGLALLGGLLLCGRCGRRMTPRYESGGRGPCRWNYTCWGDNATGARTCWSVAGEAIDRAVEALFLQTMVPNEVELSLAVEHEVGRQSESLDRAWRTRLEQAHYEARAAERRYKAVDPDNRVVARTLEGEWELRLRELQQVEQQYEEARQQRRAELTAQDRERIRQLARDLPAVWRSCTTQMADRKAMLRLVIEAIAVQPVDVPKRSTKIRVQWQSGAVSELETARPSCHDYRKHAPLALERIRELAVAGHHDDEIAQQLNREGLSTGTGLAWDLERVRATRRSLGVDRVAPDRQRNPPLPHRHPDGRYSVPGAVACFRVSRGIVYAWIRKGLVSASKADFGTHRDVYWLDIGETTAARLRARARKGGKSRTR